MPSCYGCGASDSECCDTHYVLDWKSESSLRIFVYPQTSVGTITFCNACFEARRFRDLSSEDIETLNWFFGFAYVETDPTRAISLLEPILAQARTPDSLSPLGRAYINAGRIQEGRALLREALSQFPSHPYAARDREVLAVTYGN